MKNLYKTIAIVAVIVFSFAALSLTGCEGPMGPDGLAGIQGGTGPDCVKTFL